jgi:hypothetical protein
VAPGTAKVGRIRALFLSGSAGPGETAHTVGQLMGHRAQREFSKIETSSERRWSENFGNGTIDSVRADVT